MNKLLSALTILIFSFISTHAIGGDDGKFKVNGNGNNGYIEIKDCFEKVN